MTLINHEKRSLDTFTTLLDGLASPKLTSRDSDAAGLMHTTMHPDIANMLAQQITKLHKNKPITGKICAKPPKGPSPAALDSHFVFRSRDGPITR